MNSMDPNDYNDDEDSFRYDLLHEVLSIDEPNAYFLMVSGGLEWLGISIARLEPIELMIKEVSLSEICSAIANAILVYDQDDDPETAQDSKEGIELALAVTNFRSVENLVKAILNVAPVNASIQDAVHSLTSIMQEEDGLPHKQAVLVAREIVGGMMFEVMMDADEAFKKKVPASQVDRDKFGYLEEINHSAEATAWGMIVNNPAIIEKSKYFHDHNKWGFPIFDELFT